MLARMGNPLDNFPYQHPLRKKANHAIENFMDWLGLWSEAHCSAIKIGLLHELGVNCNCWFFLPGNLVTPSFLPATFLLQVADGYLTPPPVMGNQEHEETRKIKVKAIKVFVNRVASNFLRDNNSWNSLFTGSEDSKHFLKMLFWFFGNNGRGGIRNFPAREYDKKQDREIEVLRDFLFFLARYQWIVFRKDVLVPHMEDCIRILDHIRCLPDVIKVLGPETKSYPEGTYEAVYRVASSFPNPDPKAAWKGKDALKYALQCGSQAAHIHLTRTALGA